MKLDWDAIWADFDNWYQARSRNKHCSKCGHDRTNEPDWGEQQQAIQRLVKKAIRDREEI